MTIAYGMMMTMKISSQGETGPDESKAHIAFPWIVVSRSHGLGCSAPSLFFVPLPVFLLSSFHSIHYSHSQQSICCRHSMDPSSSSANAPAKSGPGLRFHDIYTSIVQHHSQNAETSNKEGSATVRTQTLYRASKTQSLELYADLVLVFKYKQPVKGAVARPEYEQQTLKAYQDVIQKLTRVGLQYETRPNGPDMLFIFVLCPWAVLKREINRNRYGNSLLLVLFSKEKPCPSSFFYAPDD